MSSDIYQYISPGTEELPKGHKETVLLAEDETMILDVSWEMLVQLGYAVSIKNLAAKVMEALK